MAANTSRSVGLIAATSASGTTVWASSITTAASLSSELQTGKKVIPAGSTYKIRGEAYYLGDIRVFPSYTPAGKNFLIEKSKRKMVAEDIREALRCIV